MRESGINLGREANPLREGSHESGGLVVADGGHAQVTVLDCNLDILFPVAWKIRPQGPTALRLTDEKSPRPGSPRGVEEGAVEELIHLVPEGRGAGCDSIYVHVSMLGLLGAL